MYGSTILYFLSLKINNYFNVDLDRFFFRKKINLKKISQNRYSIFIARCIFPYFIHNVYYGLQKTKFSKFFIYVLFAEIPLIYCQNSIGSSLKFFTLNNNTEISFFNLIIDQNFYIPFLIILVLIFFLNYLKSKFVNKL